MKISTISDVLGYTLDTYSTFVWHEMIADEDHTDETDIDFDQYRHELSELQAEVLNKYTDRTIREFEHTSDYSPREYNFGTDNSELVVTIDYDRLKAYVTKNRSEFSQYLKENFTSYDGFMSFVPNNWDGFMAEINSADNIASDRNMAIMVGWYFKRECLNENEYLEDMYDQVGEIVYNLATNMVEA